MVCAQKVHFMGFTKPLLYLFAEAIIPLGRPCPHAQGTSLCLLLFARSWGNVHHPNPALLC